MLKLSTRLFTLLFALLPLALCSAPAAACDQNDHPSSSWIWMGGGNITGSQLYDSSVYGTQGVPAATNFPGSRYYSQSWSASDDNQRWTNCNDSRRWTDKKGNLWLYGGDGYDANGQFGLLGDLWKFNPSLGKNGEWTWMGGSTLNGQSGVYGALGEPAAANNPGARGFSMTWTDHNGRLWLFGGYGYDASGNSEDLNDLWVFDPSLGHYGEWAWMGGSNTAGNSFGQIGIYGTLGVPAAANIPGSRLNPVGWTDNNGNLWLFGGYGYDASGNSGVLNDLWKFDPSLGKHGEWTWVDGSSSVGSNFPVYGTLGEAAATNIPGGHSSSVSWTDQSGNFWLFGGLGISADNGEQILNDFWEYRFSDDQHGGGGQQGGGGQHGGGGCD